MVQAVCRTPLAPLADGLGGDAIALGEDAGALPGAGDLGPGDWCGAGVRMDLQHRSDLPLSDLDQTFKQVAIRGNSMPHRIPTMFRDLTPALLWHFGSMLRNPPVAVRATIRNRRRSE